MFDLPGVAREIYVKGMGLSGPEIDYTILFRSNMIQYSSTQGIFIIYRILMDCFPYFFHGKSE